MLDVAMAHPLLDGMGVMLIIGELETAEHMQVNWKGSFWLISMHVRGKKPWHQISDARKFVAYLVRKSDGDHVTIAGLTPFSRDALCALGAAGSSGQGRAR